MRAGINSLALALLAGVLIGLALTPDGRGWLRHPTLMFGDAANASASPTSSPEAAPPPQPAPAPIETSPLKARYAERGLRIGVFGDSMADGLWTGLYRDLRAVPDMEVIRFSEVSTGLSRYDYVDVQAKTAQQLAERPVDVAVILFGTNDAQAIEIDGVIHAFGSEGWKAAYARRVDDLVGLLRGRGVAVYWVGLPRMKRESFDGRMALINGVVSARMTALGVPYIDTVALTANADGEYDAYLSDASGRRRLMRANDGIHMSTAGYMRLSATVGERLLKDAGLAAPEAVQAPR